MSQPIEEAVVRVVADTDPAERALRRFTARVSAELRDVGSAARGASDQLAQSFDQLARSRGASDRLSEIRTHADQLVAPMEALAPLARNLAGSLGRIGRTSGEAQGAVGDLAENVGRLRLPLDGLPQLLRASASAIGRIGRTALMAAHSVEELRQALDGLIVPLEATATLGLLASRALGRVDGNASTRLRALSDSANGLAPALDGVGESLARTAAGAASAGAPVSAAGVALTGLVTAALAAAPAVSALVPALAGFIGVGAAAKTIFGGLGETAALASTDHKAYAKALAKLNGPQQDFTRALVDTREQFAGLGAELQRTALPVFTKALRDAGPLFDVIKDGLRDSADALSQFGTEFGGLFATGEFQDALRKNFSLGADFIATLAGPLATLTQSVVEFGAASGPVIETFSSGFSTLLSQGIPGFLQGLSTGIKGASEFFSGLFDAVNKLLPAFGELSGAVATSTGGAFGEFFRLAGSVGVDALRLLAGAFAVLRPVFGEFAGAFTILRISLGALVDITSNVASVLLNSLWPAFRQAGDAAGPLQNLATLLERNRIAVLEFVRVGSQAILGFAAAIVESLPTALRIFDVFVSGMLTGFATIVSGADTAFGWIPGIGPKVESASRAFQAFRTNVEQNLASAEASTQNFANRALPRLRDNRLRLDITNWTAQIAEARRQLSDKNIPPVKRTELRALISDLQRKVSAASRQLDVATRPRTVTISVRQNFTGATADLNRNGIPDLLEGRAAGGLIGGRGTGTSDSNLIRVSRGEFVVQASAVRAYGVRTLEAINAMRLPAAQAGGAISGGTGGGAGGVAIGRSVAGSLVDGLVSGLRAGIPDVADATRSLAQSSVNAAESTLEIGSPSRRFARIARDIGRGFITGLTGTASQIKAVTTRLSNDITKAFQGTRSRRDDQLVAFVTAQNKRLVTLAGQREATVKRIADAQKFAADTATQTAQAFSLQNIVQANNGSVSRISILGGLQRGVIEVRRFTAQIRDLARRGLRRDLISQLLSLGPQEGEALAASLSRQSTATLRQINAAQSQLVASSKSLGRVGADVLFDAGKRAGEGFLAGLRAQQRQIERLMLDIARGMQRAIRRALGIRSPSRVFRRVGSDAGAGLDVGFQDRVRDVIRGVRQAASAMSRTAADAIPAVQGVAPTSTLGVGAVVAAAPRNTPAVVHLTVVNRGVVGSRAETLDWLTGALDTLSRQRRLPA